MAYDKSFAQFPFVVSRTFYLPISLLGNEVAIFDHLSGAQSVPPGTTPERGCIRRISRSASAGVRHRHSPASPSRLAVGKPETTTHLKTKTFAIKHGTARRRLKFGACPALRDEFFILSYPRFPVCPVTR